MGQHEVYQILKKLDRDRWLTSRDMGNQLGIAPHKVSTIICRMKKYGEVESQVAERKTGCNLCYEHRLTRKYRK